MSACCGPTPGIINIQSLSPIVPNKNVPAKPVSVCSNKTSSCCDAPSKKSSLIKIIEIICRIALAILAAVLAPVPFFISFAVGTSIGIGYGVYLKLKNRMGSIGENKPVCASGYMEFLANQKFPILVSTLGTGVFIAAHARHDPFFYSPFIGLFTGFGVGRNLVQLGSRIFSKNQAPTLKSAV
jgi:hypothetical protein